MKSKANGRLRLVAVLITLFTLFLLSCLFFLQIVRGDHYSDKADRQYFSSPNALFDRGTIYFSTKEGNLVSAATLKQTYFVELNTLLITAPEETYRQLVDAGLPLLAAETLEKMANKTRPYQRLAERLEGTIAERVSALKLPGVVVAKERWRFYPAGRLASHVIGFLGYRGDEYAGRYGLEKTYDGVLSRQNKQTFASFFAEIFRGVSADQRDVDLLPEGDIILTIEPTVQNYLENQLAEVAGVYQPEAVAGLVLDPRTGEIIALGARPDFDPGGRVESLAALRNPLVENTYEVGSIVKALTIAAALDTGVVTRTSTYNDTGTMTLNNKRFGNYDGKARGVVSMQEVLNQSLNVGAATAALKLGPRRFRDYFHNFGLAEKTGIDVPGEVLGRLGNLDSGREIELATAAFGQGISVSPIAMVRALAALGNGGYLVEPHLVKEIHYTTKLEKTIAPTLGRRVISATTSEEISRMLTEVVDTKLSDGRAKLPHTSVAAKTGTAQMVDPITHGYYSDRYLHSFFGYFPSYEPRFLVFFIMPYPKNVTYASETLTTPFMNMVKFLINYYNIPPDR